MKITKPASSQHFTTRVSAVPRTAQQKDPLGLLAPGKSTSPHTQDVNHKLLPELKTSYCTPCIKPLSSCDQVATSNDWSVPNSGEKRSTRCSGGKIGGTWICVMTSVQTTCFQHVRSEVHRIYSFPTCRCGYWRKTWSCCKSEGLVHLQKVLHFLGSVDTARKVSSVKRPHKSSLAWRPLLRAASRQPMSPQSASCDEMLHLGHQKCSVYGVGGWGMWGPCEAISNQQLAIIWQMM